MDHLPNALKSQAESLALCLRAFDRVKPVCRVLLFGSFARGAAGRDSDVDLCVVAEGADDSLKTARSFRRAIRDIRPKPALTLVPISPSRLAEKTSRHDPFFTTILLEGIVLASEN